MVVGAVVLIVAVLMVLCIVADEVRLHREQRS